MSFPLRIEVVLDAELLYFCSYVCSPATGRMHIVTSYCCACPNRVVVCCSVLINSLSVSLTYRVHVYSKRLNVGKTQDRRLHNRTASRVRSTIKRVTRFAGVLCNRCYLHCVLKPSLSTHCSVTQLTRQNGVPLIAYHAKIHVAVNRSRSTRFNTLFPP